MRSIYMFVFILSCLSLACFSSFSVCCRVLERRYIAASVWNQPPGPHFNSWLPPICPQHARVTPLNSSTQPSTALGQGYMVPEEDRALLIHPA